MLLDFADSSHHLRHIRIHTQTLDGIFFHHHHHHYQHLHPIIIILFNAVIITVLCVSLCVLLGALVELADGATVVEGHVARGDGHVTEHQRHRKDHVI